MAGPFEQPMSIPGRAIQPEVTTAQALAWFADQLESLGFVANEGLIAAVAAAEVRRNGLTVSPPTGTDQPPAPAAD